MLFLRLNLFLNSLLLCIDPPANLVARWKFISKFYKILFDILRIAAPSALVLIMISGKCVKPFLGSGWSDYLFATSKVGLVFLLIMQAWTIFCLAWTIADFMRTVLCESLHCVVEYLYYLKR